MITRGSSWQYLQKPSSVAVGETELKARLRTKSEEQLNFKVKLSYAKGRAS